LFYGLIDSLLCSNNLARVVIFNVVIAVVAAVFCVPRPILVFTVRQRVQFNRRRHASAAHSGRLYCDSSRRDSFSFAKCYFLDPCNCLALIRYISSNSPCLKSKNIWR